MMQAVVGSDSNTSCCSCSNGYYCFSNDRNCGHMISPEWKEERQIAMIVAVAHGKNDGATFGITKGRTNFKAGVTLISRRRWMEYGAACRCRCG